MAEKPTQSSQRKLTHQQLEFLKMNYFLGSWAEIAEAFNKKFKENKSADAVRILYGRYQDEDLSGSPIPFAHFTRNSFDKAKKLNVKEGRFFVTGVMPLHSIKKDGQEYRMGFVNQEAFRTVLAHEGHAKPILLPMIAHTVLGEKQPSHYDPALTPYAHLFASEVEFNKHLRAVDMRVNPQQKNPLLDLEGQARNQSLIVAHPKPRLEFVATGNTTLPRLMCSTQVINYPAYQPNRVGIVAEQAHRMGGRIVELKGDKFFIRKVTFDKDGGYWDLGSYYHYEGVEKGRAEFIRVGDIHFGWDDDLLNKALFEIITVTQPKRILLEDSFDGAFDNRHYSETDKQLRPDWAYSIDTEIELNRRKLIAIKEIAPADCEIVLVASNHNNRLVSYVKEKRYMNDTINFKRGHELQLALLEKKNLLAHLLNLNFITYLSEDDDYFVNGIQLANHGHLGVNGSKGSKATMKKTASKLIHGHGHTPYEDGDVESVGMWTKRSHGYNHGASTWMPSVAVGYSDGSTQQIIPIYSASANRFLWRV